MSIHRCCCGEEGCWYLAAKCSCSPELGPGQLAPAIPCASLEKIEDPPNPLVFRHGTGEDLETQVCWFASSVGSTQVSVIPEGFEEVIPSTPFFENCADCCMVGCISCAQLPGTSCPGNITAIISGYVIDPAYPPIGIHPCRVPVDPFTVVMINQNAQSGPPRWSWNGNHQIFTEDGCPIDPAQANFTITCSASTFEDPGEWLLIAQLHPVSFQPLEPPEFQCQTCIADTIAHFSIPAGCECPVGGNWPYVVGSGLNLAPGSTPSASVSV